MVLSMIIAIAGALMGSWLRPRLLAPPLALALAVGLRGAIGIGAPMIVGAGLASMQAKLVIRVITDPLDDYLPLMAVGGGAALFAVAMGMLVDRQKAKELSREKATDMRKRVQSGRFVQANTQADSRDVKSEAEARQKAVLGL